MLNSEYLANEYKKLHLGSDFYRNKVLTSTGSFSLFDGAGFRPIIPFLPDIIRKYGGNILDYGCGKGVHWTKRVIDGKNLPEYLGKYLVGFRLYDPYHPLYNSKPTGTYDIIFCTDVLEHILIEDIPNTLHEIEGYLRPGGIILFTINSKLSRNEFLDGINMHVTLLSEDEWRDILDKNLKEQYRIF